MNPIVVKTADEMADALGLPEALEPDNRNHWAKQLGAETMDAGELMRIMRPEVEKILATAGHITPPSQSVRAKACIRTLSDLWCDLHRKQELNETIDPQLCMKQRMVLNKQIGILEDFLSVHRTVWILEGKPV